MKSILRCLVNIALPMAIITSLFVVSCETPGSPGGAGWVTWDNRQYKGQIIAQSVSLDTIALDIKAWYQNGCLPRTAFTYARNGNTFTVKCFLMFTDKDAFCTQAFMPFTLKVRLPVPSSGAYRVLFAPSPLDRTYDTTFTIR